MVDCGEDAESMVGDWEERERREKRKEREEVCLGSR